MIHIHSGGGPSGSGIKQSKIGRGCCDLLQTSPRRRPGAVQARTVWRRSFGALEAPAAACPLLSRATRTPLQDVQSVIVREGAAVWPR